MKGRAYGSTSIDDLPLNKKIVKVNRRVHFLKWHLHEPVEINRAPRQMLLKVPGIGPKSADRIIEARRMARLRNMSQLKALGVTTGWAAPYVLLDGRRTPEQLRLW